MNKVKISENQEAAHRGDSEAVSAVAAVLAELIRLTNRALTVEDRTKAAEIIAEGFKSVLHVDRVAVISLLPRPKLMHVSGGGISSKDSIYAQVVREAAMLSGRRTGPEVLSATSIDETTTYRHLKTFLTEPSAPQVLWMPLLNSNDKVSDVLWLERWRNKVWTENEIDFIKSNSIFFRKALESSTKTTLKVSRKWTVVTLVVVVIGLLAFIPVDSRITASAVVVPENPTYVFAPFDGVVGTLHVLPGQTVKRGELLVEYDSKVMDKNLELARQGVGTAIAELERLEGASYQDTDTLAQLPIQQIEVRRAKAEVEYLEKMLDLSRVRADADGIVVLDDPDALIGSALQTGQLVMRIADPTDTKLELMVPATDISLVDRKSQLHVRLDSDPLHPHEASVDRIGYDVTLSSKGIPSVRVDAVWDGSPFVNPGQQGTARLIGPPTTLGLSLFRKPLITLRGWLAW